MSEASQGKPFFETLKAKSAFYLGVIAGLGIMFVIGFFVMLALYFQDDSGSKTTTTTSTTNTATAADTGTTAITLAAVTDSDWLRGDKNASVTVVEFSDTECPYCKQFHATMQEVVAKYDGKVNWVYRHFPIVSLHSKAPKEAEALECAGELDGQDGFWKYTDALYAATPSNNGLLASQLPTIAEQVGLNVTKFQKCLDSGKYATKVQQGVTAATTAGAQGTPYSVIVAGDQKIPVSGAYSTDKISSLIDQLL